MDQAQRAYEEKSVTYGISTTRRNNIMKLVGGPHLRVIDIACSRGYLGKLIKERGNYVAGVDVSHAAVEYAKQVLDDAYELDIQGDWPEHLANQSFDLAVAAAVIEHVFDPVAFLKSVASTLRPAGHIIVTTPNFFSWRNRLTFLFGRFKYTEQGDFDFGHIRWFDYRYLREVLKESGFSIVRENHYYFPGKLTRILKWWPSLFATHFIVEAEKVVK
ncbi:MAG: class I SAM-dependent methyltransferase [Patescibacteria group bacterium]